MKTTPTNINELLEIVVNIERCFIPASADRINIAGHPPNIVD